MIVAIYLYTHTLKSFLDVLICSLRNKVVKLAKLFTLIVRAQARTGFGGGGGFKIASAKQGSY